MMICVVNIRDRHQPDRANTGPHAPGSLGSECDLVRSWTPQDGRGTSLWSVSPSIGVTLNRGLVSTAATARLIAGASRTSKGFAASLKRALQAIEGPRYPTVKLRPWIDNFLNSGIRMTFPQMVSSNQLKLNPKRLKNRFQPTGRKYHSACAYLANHYLLLLLSPSSLSPPSSSSTSSTSSTSSSSS